MKTVTTMAISGAYGLLVRALVIAPVLFVLPETALAISGKN